MPQGRWGYNRVVSTFGRDVLQPDGEIHRQVLGERVFTDYDSRCRLNAATHLPILVELFRQVVLAWIMFKPVVVVDMPLLFETGFHHLSHPLMVVACSRATQIRRLKRRDGLGGEAAEARLAAQMPLDQKCALANVILENEGSEEALQQQVHILVEGRLRRHAWLHRMLLSPLGVAVAVVWLMSATRVR